MLWAEPDKARRRDAAALANPVRLREWTEGLDVPSLLDLANRDCTVSQALLAAKVMVRKITGEWAKVAVAEQRTPRDPAGYPGWVPLRQLTYSPFYAAWERWPFVQVQAVRTPLCADAALRQPINEAVYDTRLPFLKEQGAAYNVLLPDASTAWLRAASVAYCRTVADLPRPTAANLLRSGVRFIGAPYIWGGVTPYGFDCSGLIYTLFHAHGVTLPRDTPEQYQAGRPVRENDLRPGDLLFFGDNGGKGRIHHVGLYAGNQKMLHAPNPKRTVRIATLRASGFRHEFAGARRIE